MKFFFSAHTDIGTTKTTNQDSCTVKSANSEKYGRILMAVVCDGMGGLSKGELASATVMTEFGKWFENTLPVLIENDIINFPLIKDEWSRLISLMNKKIGDYGSDHGISLGTTLVACLLINRKLYVVNVGDSRLYKIADSVLRLTTDHSLVAQEIANGNLKPEEEETDSRRNVLLQCIGASNIVKPEFEEYPAEINAVYVLCSDGFRHEIKEQEMLGLLSPRVIKTEADLNSTLKDIIELLKQRGEADNITAVSFKII